MKRNYQEEAYIYTVLPDVLDSPPHLLKAMCAAYMARFPDIPPEQLVMVQERDQFGRSYFYVSDMDAIEEGDIYERESIERAGRHGSGGRRRSWRDTLADWVRGQ